MYLYCGDSTATDSMPSFDHERRSGLYIFGEKIEQGRWMVEEKFEKDMSRLS